MESCTFGRLGPYRNVVDGEGVGAQQAVEDLVRPDVVDRHVQLAVDAFAALVASEPEEKHCLIEEVIWLRPFND